MVELYCADTDLDPSQHECVQVDPVSSPVWYPELLCGKLIQLLIRVLSMNSENYTVSSLNVLEC